MKIAVLLFGHLRNYRMCADSLNEFLLSKYDCDVFIHTWDETEPSTQSWHSQRTEKRQVDAAEIEIIKLKYTPKDIIVEHQEKYEKETIIDFSWCTLSNAGLHFMFDSMKKANDLRKAFEREHGISYDYVLVTRPDVNFITPIDFEKVFEEASIIGLDIDKCRFFAHEGSANLGKKHWLLVNGGCDLLFFGKPKVIDIFIEANQEIGDDYIKSHLINVPSVFVSKEISVGLHPVPFAYARGLDWNYSANTASLKSSNKIKVWGTSLLQFLLFPIFYFEKRHPRINYFKYN